LLVQPFGRNGIKLGQVFVQHDLVASEEVDKLMDVFARDEGFHTAFILSVDFVFIHFAERVVLPVGFL
jgi:hypothetical protein